jgi:hypothetical protein
MALYERTSGALFSIVAVAQLARAVLRVPAQVGTVSIPVWVSFVAFAVTGSFAIWAFRSAGSRGPHQQ